MNLDRASDSRPTRGTAREHHALPTLERKPSKLRRFMSLGSKDRRPSSRPDPPSKPGATPPLQTLSPRASESEPLAKKRTKRSLSSFLLPRIPASTYESTKPDVEAPAVQGLVPVTETVSLSLPAAVVKEDEGRPMSQRHLPVIAGSHQYAQAQARKDSAIKGFYDMPLSASRTAALTSHPVGKEDLESEGEFRTSRELDMAWTGDFVEK